MDIKNVSKKIFKVLEWIIFIVLMIILVIVASPLLPTKTYMSAHVISTGSMEPEIQTGSVVFSTLYKQEINKGDIIVFQSPDNSDNNIVHRIVDTEDDGYITKGDNNDTQDTWVVYEDNIKGEVIFTIPSVGYVIGFLKTPLGFGLIIGIPALLLILGQIRKIKEGINEEVEKRTEEEIEKRENGKKAPISIILLLISSFILFSHIPKAYALFSDTVTVEGITLAVGEIESKPSIIINEVMWSGTSLSEHDQWIELRNMSNIDINIGKWKIENLRDINKPPIMIPANRVIPANGYFLISNYPKQSKNTMLNVDVDVSNASIYLLSEGNGDLVLKDIEGNEIDRVKGDVWEEGKIDIDTGTFHSMYRGEEGSWFTCEVIDSSYWKDNSVLNCGSPGNYNL